MNQLFHEPTSLVSHAELALSCNTPSAMSVASPKAFVEELIRNKAALTALVAVL